MRTFLVVSFITDLLIVFCGAFLIGLGHPKDEYIPFFKLGIVGLLFCALLKIYIDFSKKKQSNS